MSSPQDCRVKEAFIYYVSSFKEWWVSDSLGASYYYARCTTKSISRPTQCGKNWKFGSETSKDPTATVKAGICPNLSHCENGLTLSMASAANDICVGTYSQAVNKYAFRRSSERFGTVYLLFNYKNFKWVCSNNATVSSCSSYYGIADNPGWQTMASGASINVPWKSVTTDDLTAVITCN